MLAATGHIYGELWIFPAPRLIKFMAEWPSIGPRDKICFSDSSI